MEDPLISSAKAEHARLSEQKSEIDSRLAELEVFLRVAQTISPAAARPRQAPTPPKNGRPTFKDQVVDGALQFLNDGRPKPVRDIVDALELVGPEIPGYNIAKKVARVSAVLYKSGLFNSSREERMVAEKGINHGAGAADISPSTETHASE